MLGFMLAEISLLTAAIITALATTASAVYSGEKSASTARKGRRLQERMQADTISARLRDEKVAAQAERRINKKKPDVSSLLFSEQQASRAGPASTLLAGKSGGLLNKGSLLG
jgi:hypothetical protein